MAQRRERWVAVLAVAVAMQLPVLLWVVEDAAITYAFARNWVEGHGIVAFPGTERVEGYSNPLWMLIQAVLIGLGGNPFVLEPVLGLVLGLATVVVVWHWGRDAGGEGLGWAAAAVVALSAQHAIWSQGGLENGLFSLLLALGGWRLTRGDDVGVPLAFLGLALTRPEGIAYGALAGVLSLWTAGSARRALQRVGWWALCFGVPFAVYQGVRYRYFAYALPMTFYAKIGERAFEVLAFEGRAWEQIRTFVIACGIAPFLVLLPMGVAGVQGRRAVAGAVWAGLLALALIPVVQGVGQLRAALLVGLFTTLPLLALGDRRRHAQLICAAWLWFGLLFWLRSGGDWMRGYRFAAMVVVPGALLLGTAAAELYVEIRARASEIWARRVAGVAGLGFAIGQIVALVVFCSRYDVSPYDIGERVQHYEYLARKVDLDRRLMVADADMGGLMWWGGPEILVARDTRGLVDVPFGIHGYRGKVVTEELGWRTKPDFAHTHGSGGVAMRRFERRGEFLTVPGYPPGEIETHEAQIVRRSLFLGKPRIDSGVRAYFVDDDLVVVTALYGVGVPSPEVAVGSGLFVEVGMNSPAKQDFRVLAFLHRDGRVWQSWDLPPAHGWLAPSQWRRLEVFHGAFSLPLPSELPLGTYDLGFVVSTPDGVPLRPVEALQAEIPQQPVFARGEVHVAGVVQVVGAEQVAQATAQDLDESLDLLAADRCGAAEQAWHRARHHRPRAHAWRSRTRQQLAPYAAACWARLAGGDRRGEALLQRVDDVQRARWWWVTSEPVWGVGSLLADEAWQRGMAARGEADHAAAYKWFTAAVEADPSRSWARRYAEEARAARWEEGRATKAGKRSPAASP
ncbi:MAG: hypothetical protein KTR31_37890 [Myxococcales bacterium]|nr:hypothetical protein [Myxococcales bacterium]